ncbi:MAG: hypothetical protein QOC74_4240, partial [Pseudonocardiales bacterium]|nr:hypothetical protein [Pseudonocardiales bacterium]
MSSRARGPDEVGSRRAVRRVRKVGPVDQPVNGLSFPSSSLRVSADRQPGYAVLQLSGWLESRSVDTVCAATVGLLNDVSCVVADLATMQEDPAQLERIVRQFGWSL